ncbi:MAG: GNAT family N-acetyltransferase [Salibacteraceae bacterium]
MHDPEYLIQTQRLGLRQWLPKDRRPFIAMNADPLVMEHFPAPYTEEESEGHLSKIKIHHAQNGYGWWAVDHLKEERFIGCIGLSTVNFSAPFVPAVEVGWRLQAEYWNQGLATEGAMAALFYGFQVLKLPKIVSFTALPNKASQKVMKKLGLQRKGEFDHPKLEKEHRLCRHVYYELTLNEYLKLQSR